MLLRIMARAPFRAGALSAAVLRADEIGALLRRARTIIITSLGADLDD